MNTLNNKDHLDNDKDLNNILANLAWNGKYFDSGQEVVDAGAVQKAKEQIDQYTQSKLKAFAGEVTNLIGEDEQKPKGTVLWSEYDKNQVNARNDLKTELHQSLEVLKKEYKL